MRKLAIIILCLVLCGTLGFSYPQEEYYANSFARLSYVNGDVFLQRAEDMGYEEGTVNLPVVEGDKIGTKDGRAEIHFGKKNYLRIDHYTQVDMVRLPRREDDSVSLHLFSGNIYLRISTLDREKEFEIHSPDGSFYVLEEGLYRLEVNNSQETTLYVVEGTIEAAGEEGSELVRSGERLIVANGFFTFGPDYLYAGQEDSFTEWNRGRDMLQNRYVGSRYLPVELYEYESELDYYGSWAYERPYGYVWIPNVYHYSWRPYYNGRWAWYPICGWTWVSYEPWGWCVSHYGRWHWSLSLGWYWIPTRHWGPAWVHWYHGYDYIGWCPLSYYNRPVVIVNNNFYGRYYDQYYPLHSRALTVIHKNQLSARHVSKVALDQSRVARLGKISLSSAQPNIRPSSNRISAESSAASKVLARSGLRQVSKSYSSGDALRSSQRGIVRTTGTPRISSRSQTLGKSSVTERSRIPLSATSSRTNSSMLNRNQRSSTGIKVYPSRNSRGQVTNRTYTGDTRGTVSKGVTQVLRTPTRSYSPAERIKTYPSQGSNNGSRQNTQIQRTRRYTSSSSSSRTSLIEKYSPSASSKFRSSSPSRNPSSVSRQYSSRSNASPTISRRSSISGTFQRSSSNRSSYSSSSRSSPQVRLGSPRIKSSSSGFSASRSSSSSRSFRSTSPSRISRSSSSRISSSRSSSRSSSTSRIKKK